MKVRWRLDCSDRVGIVTGYNISYCAIADDSAEGDCVGREMHQTTGPDKEQLWITGLKPWTYYKVGVAVVTRAGESEISDLLVNRTERDRPGSAPTKFNTVMLSKNKVQLSWGPPEVPNGPIDFYQVGVFTVQNTAEQIFNEICYRFVTASPTSAVTWTRRCTRWWGGRRRCRTSSSTLATPSG